MKIAYFDCFSGIAGDMALGALLDCGVPLEALTAALASLPVHGWEIAAEPVLRAGIHALAVRITLDGVSDEAELEAARRAADSHHHEHTNNHSHGQENGEAHHHPREHESDHELRHDHDHLGHHHHDHALEHPEHQHPEHEHDHTSHHHGRSLAEIREVIRASQLSDLVKAGSLNVFNRIAAAEGHLHHAEPDDVHFHEIGGVDSLLDIVGVCWCLEYLGIEAIYCSALPYSTGFVDCAHGRIPLPAPATLEILKGAPWVTTGLEGELVTPTGAGIVAALATGFGTPPAFSVEAVGAGAGKKQLPDRPNLLRVLIGLTQENTEAAVTSGTPVPASSDGLEWRELLEISSNLDDMNPELWDSVWERLFEVGALDVWLTNIQMKKNRPAQQLHVLCDVSLQAAIVRTILTETSTLGVRVASVQRAAMPREAGFVTTAFGKVKVKWAYWDEGGIRRATPEYDDVKRIARATGNSAREIYEAALRAS